MRFRPFVIASAIFLIGSVDGSASNRIIVQSTTVPDPVSYPCATGEVTIFIESDVPLNSVSIPLVVRSIGAPAFWSAVSRKPSTGRLASSLSKIQVLETGLADFVSPDQVALYFEAADPADCMPAGPLEAVTGLAFVPTGVGNFEIDTMFYSPCRALQFIQCADLQPVALDEFTMGIITVYLPTECPYVDFDSTSLTAWAGGTISNGIHVFDLSGDSWGFDVISGPGRIDSLAPTWRWESSPSDSGTFTVQIEAYDRDCPARRCYGGSFTGDA
jgi:hypothetical protein